MACPPSGLINRVAERQLEPVPSLSPADHRQVCAIRRPVRPGRIVRYLPRISSGKRHSAEGSAFDEGREVERIEVDGQFPSRRDAQQFRLFQPQGPGIRAIEAGGEQFYGLALQGSAINDGLAIRGKTRSEDGPSPEREAMEAWRRDCVRALAHDIKADA